MATEVQSGFDEKSGVDQVCFSNFYARFKTLLCRCDLIDKVTAKRLQEKRKDAVKRSKYQS